jgi:hypothetical protein
MSVCTSPLLSEFPFHWRWCSIMRLNMLLERQMLGAASMPIWYIPPPVALLYILTAHNTRLSYLALRLLPKKSSMKDVHCAHFVFLRGHFRKKKYIYVFASFYVLRNVFMVDIVRLVFHLFQWQISVLIPTSKNVQKASNDCSRGKAGSAVRTESSSLMTCTQLSHL